MQEEPKEITIYKLKNPSLYIAKNSIFHPGKYLVAGFAIKKIFKNKFFSRAFFAIGAIKFASSFYFQNYMISEIRFSKSKDQFLKIKYGLWGDDWINAGMPDILSMNEKMKEMKGKFKERKEKFKERKMKFKKKFKKGKEGEEKTETDEGSAMIKDTNPEVDEGSALIKNTDPEIVEEGKEEEGCEKRKWMKDRFEKASCFWKKKGKNWRFVKLRGRKPSGITLKENEDFFVRDDQLLKKIFKGNQEFVND